MSRISATFLNFSYVTAKSILSRSPHPKLQSWNNSCSCELCNKPQTGRRHQQQTNKVHIDSAFSWRRRTPAVLWDAPWTRFNNTHDGQRLGSLHVYVDEHTQADASQTCGDTGAVFAPQRVHPEAATSERLNMSDPQYVRGKRHSARTDWRTSSFCKYLQGPHMGCNEV